MNEIRMIVDAKEKAGDVISTVPPKLANVEAITTRITKLARPELPWIVRREGEDLLTHYKKLLTIHHSDEVGHLTSFCVGIAMLGCIDLQLYSDIRAILRQEILELVDVSIEEFVQTHDLDIDINDLSDYDKISPYYCIYSTGILLTLIGKRLNDQNYKAWIEARNNSFAVPLGFTVTDPSLFGYQPSQVFAANFYSEVKSRWLIRRRLFVETWALSSKPGMLGTTCKTVLTLLRGAELTNFANISQWLLVLNPEIFCWNTMAKSLPLILRAYKKFISVGPLADWIKLILPDEHVREFHHNTLKVPFTIARQIAITYGNSTLSQVDGTDRSPETQMLFCPRQRSWSWEQRINGKA
ncbi:unnamed protein product [Bemisia tabaci]|uniref:Uncharacterized protein n=1 Tax=Bemisia tabaci TaxID=7038 RepID=A0A9P0G5L0_BEMTA|nr:unnamed protein product [Bemisia tabaci]